MRRKTSFNLTKKKKYNPIGDMIIFESVGLEPKREKKLFQHLVNTGQAWTLQGFYGRRAADMLKKGIIKPPKKKTEKNTTDYYGNKIDFKKF